MKSLLFVVLAMTFGFAAHAQELQGSLELAEVEGAPEGVLGTLPEAQAVHTPDVPEGPDFESGYRNHAVLQGLNKVTARISSIEVPVGVTTHFGNLEIVVKRCWRAPPTEQPENAALLEILDRRPGETPLEVFNGWMFSSSPSLAGLEHPVYDVIILSCEDRTQDATH